MRTVAAALLLLRALPLQAQDRWRLWEGSQGRRTVTLEREASAPGGSCSLRLSFISVPGEKGGARDLSLELVAMPESGLEGINLDYFEGPDAPAMDDTPLRITVVKGRKKTRFRAGVAGWRLAGFVFASLAPKARSGYVRKVVELAAAGADRIEVAIVDGTDPKKVVSASFPVAGDRDKFRSLLGEAP